MSEKRAVEIVETAIHYAAIGTDGTRPVVWGVGDTEEDAINDVDVWALGGASKLKRLRLVTISAERRAAIVLGDVDASDLWINTKGGTSP
jgi:hypothetical protein